MANLRPFGWIFTPRMKDALTIAIDNREIVLCINCKHRPKVADESEIGGFGLEFPDQVCPCQCLDGYYSWMPRDNWFCGDGEKEGNEQ